MEIGVVLFLSSGLFLGWSLGANDAANIFGTAVGTRMLKFGTAAVVGSIFVVLGATFSGSGASHTLGKLGAVNALGGAFTAAFAAALTVYWMTRARLPVSTSQAIVGAIIGWNLFAGVRTEPSTLLTIVMTWVLCPVLSAVTAVVLYKSTIWVLRRTKPHILALDQITRIGLVFAGAFGAYSLGANNIANVMGVFVSSVPLPDFELIGVNFTGVQQLFFLGAVAIAVGIVTYSKRVMMTVGKGLMPLSPVAAWIVVMSHSIVLFLFASEGLEYFLASNHLPTIPLVPVSSSQAVVGAVVGIGLYKGGSQVDWSVAGKIASGWITTPIISAVVSILCLFILQNLFVQEVYKPIQYEIDETIINQLRDENIEHPSLSLVVDKRMQSASELVRNLEGADLSSKEIDYVVELSRLREMEIVMERADLKKLSELLTDPQIAALRKLEGASFKYGWQFEEKVAELDPSWILLEENVINKQHNRKINLAMQYVEDTFSAVDGLNSGENEQLR